MSESIRTLTAHKVNDINNQLNIEVVDKPGHGGACHTYFISSRDTGIVWPISFQDGPIANGLTHEALLAILIDRMEGFQSGPYPHENNAVALVLLRTALDLLHSRTKERIKRGVEGTHQP